MSIRTAVNDAIAEVNWYKFEEPLTRFDNLKSQLEGIRELIAPNGEEDWFDDDGNWTEEGVAVAGTYIQSIEIDKESLKETQDVLKKLNKPYKGNEKYYKGLDLGIDSEQDLYDKRNEYQEKELEYLQSIQNDQQAVVDMYEAQIDAIEEYTDTLIESYNDYIDVVKETLDAERDLYEFRKNIQSQTKDIAELERKIAALSGSDDHADIAERRKLEAELYEAREGLNDSYYDHATDAQSNALDEEAEAYEESMHKYIEGLRETLDTATADMTVFLEGIVGILMLNATTIETQYTNTGLTMDSALTTPWINAAKATKGYEEDALSLMNQWTTEEGYFGKFKTNATSQLKSPWSAGTKAAKTFRNDVKDQMEKVVSNIKSNVSSAKTELSNLYKQIQDTEKKASSIKTSGGIGDYTGGGGIYTGGGSSYITGDNVKALQKILNKFFGANIGVDGVYGPATTTAVEKAQNIIKNYLGNRGYRDLPQVNGEYDAKTKQTMQTYFNLQPVGSWFKDNKISIPPAMYAKGTLGTKKDEWAITDESWIGEEITLAAGKNGQLQYLKKGSAVMPADISANLVEWGKLNPNMMNIGSGVAGVNIISNAINKPEFNLTFDALVKADRIDEGTLPEVKKFVQQEINSLVKQMNYGLKKSGAR
jgi:hypothetical protein